MKILVLGAGGIGGYYGGRLAESGADVTFLVRAKRREQIARDGLVIESPLGNAKLAAKTVVAGDLKVGWDLVLFTCKAYDLDSAMDAVAPAMDGRCALLPMLNGMAHFERLDARFGAASVLGGTCHINATLKADGTVLHMEPLNNIFFGERDGTKSQRTLALAAQFAKTSVKWTHSEDILQELWEKVVFLSTLATVTCLMRGNVGEIMAAPGGRETMERCLAANVEVASREGRPPRPKAVERARERLTGVPTASASMLRDMEAGKAVEADHVVGYMLERARKHGIDDTVQAIAYAHLMTYEARRAAGRLA